MGLSRGNEVPRSEKADQVTIRPVHVPSKEIKPSLSLQPQNRSKRDLQPGEKIPEDVEDDDEKSEEDHEEWPGRGSRHSKSKNQKSANVLEWDGQSRLVLS